MEIVRVGYAHPDVLALVEQVQEFYVERYGGRDDTPLTTEEFEPPGGSFFVGYLEGAAVATGAWRRRGDVAVFDTTSTAEIKRMYVVPSRQRLGLAGVMLAHLERTAEAAGAVAMVLETGTRQPEAIAFYEGRGYTPIPGFGHYRESPANRCFGKRLTPG